MQCDINPSPGHPAVWVEKATKRIKRRGRICIQQRIAQPGLAHFADGDVLPFVARVPETRFPVPRLEVIGNPSHFTAQADVKQLVPIGEFFAPWARIVKAAEPDPGGDRNRISVNNNSGVPNCERIKCILDWHTDAERTTGPYGRKRRTVNTGNSVEWIGRKWHSGQRRIEKRACIFEVGKHREVFIAQVARERSVVHLTVSRRQRWRESGEVEGQEFPIWRNPSSRVTEVVANTKICRADIKWGSESIRC